VEKKECSRSDDAPGIGRNVEVQRMATARMD